MRAVIVRSLSLVLKIDVWKISLADIYCPRSVCDTHTPIHSP